MIALLLLVIFVIGYVLGSKHERTDIKKELSEEHQRGFTSGFSYGNRHTMFNKLNSQDGNYASVESYAYDSKGKLISITQKKLTN